MAKKNNTPAKPKLPPEEALYQALSLCRKAGALTMGFDAVEDACVKSKAWLVMVASDASAKTVQLSGPHCGHSGRKAAAGRSGHRRKAGVSGRRRCRQRTAASAGERSEERRVG